MKTFVIPFYPLKMKPSPNKPLALLLSQVVHWRAHFGKELPSLMLKDKLNENIVFPPISFVLNLNYYIIAPAGTPRPADYALSSHNSQTLSQLSSPPPRRRESPPRAAPGSNKQLFTGGYLSGTQTLCKRNVQLVPFPFILVSPTSRCVRLSLIFWYLAA